jgi:hypothetical protein
MVGRTSIDRQKERERERERERRVFTEMGLYE